MTTKFYRKMYLRHEFLPVSAAIPAAQFKSITLCREDGTVKIALTLRDENSNPFEKFLKIPCSPEQVKEYLVCLRKQRQVEFQEVREIRAWNYVYAPWRAYKESSGEYKRPEEFHPLFSVEIESKENRVNYFYRFKNPRPGIDAEEYIEIEESYSSLVNSVPKPILHTFVTVWHKGMKKVQSQTGYSESHRTRELSWTEAADLLRKWTAEAKRQEQEKEKDKEYQHQEEEYRERWKDMEGMRLGQGGNSPVISCQYGGPHVADYCGNYMFPIPKDVKSYTELCSKIGELLEDYYANCE